MKIAYIFQSMAKMAGTERILTDKMNYLAERYNYEIYLITCEQGNHHPPFPLSPKVNHFDLNVRFFILYKYNILKRIIYRYWFNIKYKKKLKKTISEIKPDIICCTTYSLFEIKALMNLKDDSIKIIESHTAKRSNEKQKKHNNNKLLHFLAKKYDNKVYNLIKNATALVALTNGDASEWENVKKAIVIPNMMTYYPHSIPPMPRTNKVISAGRLSEQKGYDMLIDTWNIVYSKHPNWTLHIYGIGEEKTTLLKKIQDYELENIVFIHDPVSDIYSKFMESDFYVMSSRWEGFALVLLEAMSCSLPCVSFDCPYGPSDIIKNNEDGLLVENGNIEELAERICYMIEHEDKRIRMGKMARENVKLFLPEKIMPQWETLFKSLINQKT